MSLVVAKKRGVGCVAGSTRKGGEDWEFRINRGKLVYIGWIKLL